MFRTPTIHRAAEVEEVCYLIEREKYATQAEADESPEEAQPEAQDKKHLRRMRRDLARARGIPRPRLQAANQDYHIPQQQDE